MQKNLVPGPGIDETESLDQPSPDKTEQDVWTIISQMPGAPSKETIDNWKSQYGDVYASILPVSEELLIFRAINRRDWRNLVASTMEGTENKTDWVNEQLCQRCSLHPKLTPETIRGDKCKGGTIDTLADQIMRASNFYPADFSMTLIRKI